MGILITNLTYLSLIVKRRLLGLQASGVGLQPGLLFSEDEVGQ